MPPKKDPNKVIVPRHLSCEGCRLRKMKCTRTFPCMNCTLRGFECKWKGSAPSRSPHDRSPEASKQEIHRLRRIVDLLTTRISELEYFRHPPSHAYPHYHQPHYLQTPPSTASTSFDRHSLPSFPPAPPSTASTSFDPHSFPTFPSAESLPPYGRSHSWDLEVDADGVEIAQRVEQRRDVAAWAMREYQRTLAVGERSARAREGYERA